MPRSRGRCCADALGTVASGGNKGLAIETSAAECIAVEGKTTHGDYAQIADVTGVEGNDSARETLSIRKFDRRNYSVIEMFANFEPVTDVLHLLQSGNL